MGYVVILFRLSQGSDIVQFCSLCTCNMVVVSNCTDITASLSVTLVLTKFTHEYVLCTDVEYLNTSVVLCKAMQVWYYVERLKEVVREREMN